jgi:hypothetical protein
MLLRTIKQDKTTHALETRPLPRLRTPLLVLRRWPSAGEAESGITLCADVIGVRNRRFVCVLACEWCVVKPTCSRSCRMPSDLNPAFSIPSRTASSGHGEIRDKEGETNDLDGKLTIRPMAVTSSIIP